MFIQALLNPETDEAVQTNPAPLRSDDVDQQQNVQIYISSNSNQPNTLPVFVPTTATNEAHPQTTNNGSLSQRSKKMQMQDKTEKCPICDAQLSSAIIKEHIEQELSKLNETPSTEAVNVRRGAALHARKKVQNQIHLLKDTRSEDDHEEVEVSNHKEVLNSIKKRRQTRQHTTEQPASKRRTSTPSHTSSSSSSQMKQECFMCGEILAGDLDDINAHIDRCLNGNGTTAPSSSSVSSPRKSKQKKTSKRQSNHVEPEEQVETYVWCNETRVRSCSVVGEGYAELVNADRLKIGDESAELDVMEDDLEAQFGAPQYSEADLIHIDEDENESEKTLRKRVSDNFQNHTHNNNNNNENQQYSNTQRVEEVNLTIQTTDSPHTTPLIEALKAKIVELQKLATNSYKCLVCLEQYQVPLVSIQCWHVYCEKCWLSALGTKKLCPQCKTITTPNDLRKIFL